MRESVVLPLVSASSVDREALARFICGVQKPDGEIPWSEGGKTDPWDHVESAMGLSVAGRFVEAEKAYAWLARRQRRDGSWFSAYRGGIPEDATRDANFSAYVAVGVFQHYLITQDRGFLNAMWPVLEGGIHFAVSMQAPTGEIYWAKNRRGTTDRMALLTGSCSVYMSLKCALMAAMILGKRRPRWERALLRLGDAIRNRPSLFNMMKSRFSMDWYYPVLCGACSGREAKKRIDRSWDKFVVPGWGVRCVSDRPWVTVAETSELVLSLLAVDDRERASMVFEWILDKKFDNGAFWMGVTFPDRVVWPEDQTSWTAAAVLLAHDALFRVTPASCLFDHRFWKRILPVAVTDALNGEDRLANAGGDNDAGLAEAAL